MSQSQRRAFAAGIALLLGALVVLGIALVRLHAALLGQHVALLTAALPFVGLALGGIIASAVPGLGRAPRRLGQVAHVTAFAAGAAALSVIGSVRVKPVDTLDRAALIQLGLSIGLSLLPFTIGGVAIAGAFGAARGRFAGAFGFWALGGAAAGVMIAGFTMRFGPPRLGLGVAVVVSLAALSFALASRRVHDEPPASAGIVATFVLGTMVLLAGEIGAPYLKLGGLRWSSLDRVEHQEWTDRGLFTVDKPQANNAWLRADGTFGTQIVEGKQLPPLVPEEMPYLLHKEQGPVLVVGAGGGREIRHALRQGQKDVHAVEAELAIAGEVMRNRSRAFSGDVYDKPEVHVAFEGLRSYVRRTPLRFRNVVLPYADTGNALGAGALAVTPSPLFTVEAFTDVLSILVPEGTMMVTRPEAETDRLLALTAAALGKVGVKDPAAHLFGCSKDKLVSLLIKRSPLDKEELKTLDGHCKRYRFALIVAPDVPKAGARRDLAHGADPLGVGAALGVDLRPPTDDRPFWFSTIAPKQLVSTVRNVGALKESQRAVFALLAVLALAVVLKLLAFVLPPLFAWRHIEGARGSALRAAMALAGVGAGAVLIGRTFIERVAPVIGRNDLATAVVPTLLFLALGVGFWLGGRPADRGAQGAAFRWALALLFVLAPLLMGLEAVFGAALGLTLGARLGVTAAVLMPMGIGLGAVLGLVTRIAGSRGPAALAWAFGLGGAAAAGALVVGIFASMLLGYSAAVLAGGLAVLFGAAMIPQAREVAPPPAPVRAAVPSAPEIEVEAPRDERETLPEIELGLADREDIDGSSAPR
ncbi:hypothetical protein [Polyangium aurulentum]|uniref:hypothetical protein n=1 Tax=Polyangium aurulentum TaxID=2567896 RepID=UPI0010AEAF47|nr:hypothetical protein [Polyangium aurulentum]UQA55662.1 hypothetical protein E8A73_030540 [Polyangium aurulentum]